MEIKDLAFIVINFFERWQVDFPVRIVHMLRTEGSLGRGRKWAGINLNPEPKPKTIRGRGRGRRGSDWRGVTEGSRGRDEARHIYPLPCRSVSLSLSLSLYESV